LVILPPFLWCTRYKNKWFYAKSQGIFGAFSEKSQGNFWAIIAKSQGKCGNIKNFFGHGGFAGLPRPVEHEYLALHTVGEHIKRVFADITGVKIVIFKKIMLYLHSYFILILYLVKVW